VKKDRSPIKILQKCLVLTERPRQPTFHVDVSLHYVYQIHYKRDWSLEIEKRHIGLIQYAFAL